MFNLVDFNDSFKNNYEKVINKRKWLNKIYTTQIIRKYHGLIYLMKSTRLFIFLLTNLLRF